jgi:hypothetical protein
VDLGPHVGDWVTASTRCALDGIGTRAGEPSLKRGLIPRPAVTLSHFLQLLRPFSSESSAPLLHSHFSAFRHCSRHGFTGSSRALPDREEARHGAPPARMECAVTRLEDPGRRYPLGDLAAGEFVLFVSYLSCGLALPISPFFMLLLEDLGLQLQHLTPHSILQVSIFAHLCEMFVGVAPCTSLFRHFFVLVKSGKAKDHLGAYYFQMRVDSAGAYISSLSSARWENWRAEWVIASTEASDRLVLPSDGPRLDKKQWRAKQPLTPEFEPVLGRIESLATGGLTSMHVVGDFLKRRIAPLQARARLSCWFTGSNDLGRVHRGLGTDLSWEELELLVKGITGESFVAESLIPPEGIPSLCDDQGLRAAILDWLPTLDESGVAVRQTGGREPHRGIQIPGVPAGGSRPADAGSRAPPAALSPSDKGKGVARSSSAPGGSGRSEGERRHRLRRADGSFVADPPLDSDLPQKRQRTAGGVEEAGSPAQGSQRRISPPPAPP